MLGEVLWEAGMGRREWEGGIGGVGRERVRDRERGRGKGGVL